MTKPTATITVRVPVSLKQRLERLAKSTERSKSWLALDALQAYVDAQDWQIREIEAGIREADAGEFASDEEVQDVIAKWTRDAH